MSNMNLNSFNEEMVNTDKLILIDFYTNWCGPCKMLSPIISEIGNEYANSIDVYKINVDENQDLASKYNIVSVPTLVFLKNEKIVKTTIGFRTRSELSNIIEDLL